MDIDAGLVCSPDQSGPFCPETESNNGINVGDEMSGSTSNCAAPRSDVVGSDEQSMTTVSPFLDDMIRSPASSDSEMCDDVVVVVEDVDELFLADEEATGKGTQSDWNYVSAAVRRGRGRPPGQQQYGRKPTKQVWPKTVNTGQLLNCPLEECHFQAKSKGLLDNHVSNVHRHRRFLCTRCSLRFLRRHHLVQHLRKVHKVSALYSCPLCAVQVSTSREFTTHFDVRHKTHLLDIETRNAALLHAGVVEESFDSIEMNGNQNEPMTSAVANTRMTLKREPQDDDASATGSELTVDATNTEPGSVRSLSRFSPRSLLAKERTVAGAEPNEEYGPAYQCGLCHYVFLERVPLMRDHAPLHKTDSVWCCSHCAFTSASSRAIDKHRGEAHSGLRPYRCFQCNTTHSYHRHLIRHLQRKHKLIVFFVCPICGETFEQRFVFDNHLWTKHADLAVQELSFSRDRETTTTAAGADDSAITPTSNELPSSSVPIDVTASEHELHQQQRQQPQRQLQQHQEHQVQRQPPQQQSQPRPQQNQQAQRQLQQQQRQQRRQQQYNTVQQQSTTHVPVVDSNNSLQIETRRSQETRQVGTIHHENGQNDLSTLFQRQEFNDPPNQTDQPISVNPPFVQQTAPPPPPNTFVPLYSRPQRQMFNRPSQPPMIMTSQPASGMVNSAEMMRFPNVPSNFLPPRVRAQGPGASAPAAPMMMAAPPQPTHPSNVVRHSSVNATVNNGLIAPNHPILSHLMANPPNHTSPAVNGPSPIPATAAAAQPSPMTTTTTTPQQQSPSNNVVFVRPTYRNTPFGDSVAQQLDDLDEPSCRRAKLLIQQLLYEIGMNRMQNGQSQ